MRLQGDCAGNRLVNGAFEAGFSARGRLAEQVAEGWSAWYETLPGVDGINYVPDYLPRRAGAVAGAPFVHGGLWSQEMATERATHTAGLFQRVSVPLGATVRASAWAFAWATEGSNPARSDPPGTYVLAIGIDPRGGDDPHATDLRWTEPITITDLWVPLALEMAVEGPVITVFTRGAPRLALAHNASRWDDACLQVLAVPGEEPAASPRPPTPTATLALGARPPTQVPGTAEAIGTRLRLDLEVAATATAVANVPAPVLGPEVGFPGDAEPSPVPAGADPGADTGAGGAAVGDWIGLAMLAVAAFVGGLLLGLGREGRR